MSALKFRFGICGMAIIAMQLALFTACTTPMQREDLDIADGPLASPAPPIEITEDARNRSRALALFAQGHIHELNRQPDRAIALYREALRYDPDSNQLHLRLALALIRANQFADAADVFESLADRQPNQAQPLLWQGAMYRQRNQLDEAKALYMRALEREPSHPQAYIYLYELMLQRGQLTEAAELLERAIDAVEDPVPFYRFLGETRLQQSLLAEDLDEQEGLQQDAIRAWESARELAPEESDLWSKLGLLYLQLQDIDRAEEYLAEAVRLTPTLLEAKDSLVAIYRLQGRIEEAAAILESMGLQQPNNARIFLSLGEIYEQLGDTERAIRSYRAASQVGRPAATTYLRLAVLQMEDDPEQAIADLREGLSLIPGDPRLLELLGMLAFYQGDFATTLTVLSEAEAFWSSAEGTGDPFMTHTPVFLALAHYHAGDYEEAATRLFRAMKTSPDALETFVYFVVQDEDHAKVADIASFIAPLLDDQPDHLPGLIALGYLYSFTKDFESARDALQRAYDLAHRDDQADQWLDARFFFWYAAAHERLEDYERAEELFYRSLELDPEGAETYNYLAYMWAELDQNLETAERYVLIALEARPDSAAFIDTLGWVYYRQGRFEEAYEQIRRAADILPDDPVITDHLGDIYYALGNLEEAIRHWQMALELNPDNPDEIQEKLLPHLGPSPDDLEYDISEEYVDPAYSTDDESDEPFDDEPGEEAEEETESIGDPDKVDLD